MIIGLSGWKRSGKDLAAELLKNKFGFKRLAFADALKDMVSEQYEIDKVKLYDQKLKEEPLMKYPVNPTDDFGRIIVNFLHKEFYINYSNALYWTPCSKFWTQKTLGQIGAEDNVVITDLRYKSEALNIREYAKSIGQKSFLIRINRFEESLSLDPSERDLDDYSGFDVVIENKTSIARFEKAIFKAVRQVF